jgi:hypothetical protein
LNPEHNIDSAFLEYFGPLNSSIISRINTSGCSAVIIHTLNEDLLELALNLSESIPLIWRSWGADLHDIIYPDLQPLLPRTLRLLNDRNSLIESVFSKFRPVLDLINKKTGLSKSNLNKKLEFLKRINCIATVTRTEFDLLIGQIPWLDAKYINFNYRSLHRCEILKNTTELNQNIIMIGHSSFPYHNHADVFYQLSEFSNFTSTVMVPLSYGNALYRDKIISLGTRIFNSQAHYLVQFLPFEEYLKEISRCKVFILNSKVQSGGANVIYSLLLGLKVYLRKENPIYSDFKRAGIKLFSIQDELSSEHLDKYLLSDSDKQKNWEIIRCLFNPESEISNVRNIYNNLRIMF